MLQREQCVIQWIWRDPDALLQVPKSLSFQPPPQSFAQFCLRHRQIEDEKPPSAIPMASPAGNWVHTSQCNHASTLGKPHGACAPSALKREVTGAGEAYESGFDLGSVLPTLEG